MKTVSKETHFKNIVMHRSNWTTTFVLNTARYRPQQCGDHKLHFQPHSTIVTSVLCHKDFEDVGLSGFDGLELIA